MTAFVAASVIDSRSIENVAHAGPATVEPSVLQGPAPRVRGAKKRKSRAGKARVVQARPAIANKRRKRVRGVVKRRRGYMGWSVPKSELRKEPLPKPSGEIWVYAVNFREEMRVNIYQSGGDVDEGALAQLDGEFRCKRTGSVRAVDPRLYEVLSIIYDHFGQRRIDLISGFRNQKNESSRHFHGAAMDIYVPGVSLRELFEFAESLDTGGMGIGIYPRSGFVHIDMRAPGEPSYRWRDNSGKKKQRKKKPTS